MKTLSKLLLLVSLIAAVSCSSDTTPAASKAVTLTSDDSRIKLLEVTVLANRTTVYIVVVDDVEYFVNAGGGIVPLDRH